MNRYSTNYAKISNRFDGKQVFLTTRYPIIPVRDSDLYVTVTSEDFLDSMAKKFYKDESLWWIIAQANNIKGTMKPKIGQQIRIPTDTDYIISRFVRANS
jgi:nucleoid-associated protein YgaU